MEKFEAINPKNGDWIREATADEIAVYMAQKVKHPCFRVPVIVGDVLIQEDRGPGIAYHGIEWLMN